ncbi:MAG: hypothetical protein J3K34DRAFT_441845 [Monoraphidium minutum]|nr:MAG: hypothetical protein J3K34DRAFT_441845 [Monoraphidium minutum]
MPRGVLKSNLPSKICESCQRPFTWRKVWEKCWDDVKTCSDRCKSERRKQLQALKRPQQPEDGFAAAGPRGPTQVAGPPQRAAVDAGGGSPRSQARRKKAAAAADPDDE